MLSARALFLCGAAVSAYADTHVEGKGIRIEFNQSLHNRVIAKIAGKEIVLGGFRPSEHITIAGRQIADFRLGGEKRQNVRDALGSGRRWLLTGSAPSLSKTVTVTLYDEFPRLAVFEVQYTNTGNSELAVDGWTNHDYSIDAPQTGDPAFWSFQSGSYRNRPDWVLPLKPSFHQDNFLGMNSTDYGGGTPVVDVWRKDVGIGVGHLELAPKLVSLPVAMPDSRHATLALFFKTARRLEPGAALKTFRTFVAVHSGDYFGTLEQYARVMERQGIRMEPAPESAFGPVWCAWGFGKPFTPAQVTGALPVVKKLGFTWVTVDDGWQNIDGDWLLDAKKFPNGDQDMRSLAGAIHTEGFKAQLWWAPLAAKPDSDLVRKHPDQLLLNADGSQQKISYWNDWYLCPADPNVLEHHRKLVVHMMKTWDYDGLKLDGQHMNGVPPCYNPAHKHARPEESVESLPRFFKMIYDTARSIKRDALVEWCPCGTAFSFFTLPYLNMSVASDPRGSFQVRSKGKTLKALHGDAIAYFGDHVELSTGRDDFASTIGIGGVVGTNFTWPPGAAQRNRLDLTEEKEKLFARWIGLYKEKMLSRGEYLGSLYDIGFDRPEAHAIRKSRHMYYAFYAPEWDGQIELRGLGNGAYRVSDYVEGKDLGVVRGPVGTLKVQFKKYLLLQAAPM
jgi:alpha-galactosidase